jgi:hypothetical protein
MTLETVINNLNNAISGKQELLDILTNHPNNEVGLVIIQVLNTNIGELRRIREDLLRVQICQKSS